MILTKKAISRRTMLRGVGATLALPLLDGMIPAFTVRAKTVARPVARFLTVYVPNGIVMERWTPTSEGNAFEFTPTLRPHCFGFKFGHPVDHTPVPCGI